MALSDDVENAAGTAVNKTGQVIGGTIRGGLLGAAGTFVAGALGIGIASGIGAAGAAGATALGTIGAGVAATFAGAGLMLTTFAPLLLVGAAIGAALLGVGALIPSVSTMGKGVKKLMPKQRDKGGPEVIVEHHDHYITQPAPQQKRVIVCDNPDFQPGRGAAMAEKGDCAPSPTVCR